MAQKLLTPDEVRDSVRLSRPTIHRLRRKGKFAEPIILGERKIAWIEAEINAWLENRERAGSKQAA